MGSLLDRVRRVRGCERASPLLGILAGALLIVALPAQTALASTIDVVGRELDYTADPGEANGLVVDKDTSGGVTTINFSDPGATISIGSDPNAVCSVVTAVKVICVDDSTGTGGPSFNKLVIDVGDEDDTVHNNTNIKSEIHGGDGEDNLFGGSNDDVIHGDDDDDKIHGEAGNDQLFGDAGDDFIEGNAGDDEIDGGDGDDDLSGGDNDDIIDTGLGTGVKPEIVLGGDGDDVVFFHYDASPADVTITKNGIQEIKVDTDDNALRLTTVEQLHIFNEHGGASTDDYKIDDLTGTTLKVLVLQSDDANSVDDLKAGASITAEGTTGPDRIVLNQQNVIGTVLPTLTMGNGQTPWGRIVFQVNRAGAPGTLPIIVNANEGDDSFDVDLSLPLGNEVTTTLNGGSGTNTLGFVKPQANVFELDLSSPGTTEAGTVTAGSALGDIKFTDISAISLDGKGGTVAMTVITPRVVDDIVYKPGDLNGTGDVQVLDIIKFSFKGVGSKGSLTFDDPAGAEDNLEYNGSSRNETFTLFEDGDITLTSNINSVEVHTPGIADLTLNAGNGNDIVDVTDGPVPWDTLTINGEDGNDTVKLVGKQTAVIKIDGGAPSASDTLILGIPHADVVIDLENDTVSGFAASPIDISAIEHIVLDGGGSNDLDILGLDGDDEINYIPTASDAGKICGPIGPTSPNGTVDCTQTLGHDLKDITFSNVSGDLEIDGGTGDNTIRTIGTGNADRIDITALDPDSTTQVIGLKKLFTPNDDTTTLAVDSRAGKDVINYIAGDCGVALHLLLDGNTPDGDQLSGDTLNVDAGGTSEIFPGHDPAHGNVNVCVKDEESEIEYERIERVDLSEAGGPSGNGATQPDGVFTNLNTFLPNKVAKNKVAGEDVYGNSGTGLGGQNAGPNRGPRLAGSGGSLKIPFIIENDGPSGSDSYLVIFSSEKVNNHLLSGLDGGLSLKVSDGNTSKSISGGGATVGPIDQDKLQRADFIISSSGAKQGRHKIIVNIFSVKGGGKGSSFVDSVVINFVVGK